MTHNLHIVLLVAAALLAAMVVLALVGRRQPPFTAADAAASSGAPRDAYWYHLLVALDCFANAVAGGMIGETISARCGRWALVVKGHGTGWHWLARFMCKWLGTIQPDHGQRAIAGALARAQQVVAVEEAALVALVPPEAAATETPR